MFEIYFIFLNFPSIHLLLIVLEGPCTLCWRGRYDSPNAGLKLFMNSSLVDLLSLDFCPYSLLFHYFCLINLRPPFISVYISK